MGRGKQCLTTDQIIKMSIGALTGGGIGLLDYSLP
jgi:hypothetical protein